MSPHQPLPSSKDDLPEPPIYRQRPRPVGAGLSYTLESDVLVVDSAHRIDRVPLSAVEQVRFTFKPSNFTTTGYITQLRLSDGRTIAIGDISWRSAAEIERGGARYVSFIAALCGAISCHNPKARFVAGKALAIWVTFACVAAITVMMMGYFAWRAWAQGYTGAMWIGLVLGAIAIWQMVPMVWLNRPLALGTGEIPAHLMPQVDPDDERST